MIGTIEYKKKRYSYNHNNNFNDFMSTEIFRILIKDMRSSKDNLSLIVKRDTEPYYSLFTGFVGFRHYGTYLTINGNEVIGVPDYAINGLLDYANRYIFNY